MAAKSVTWLILYSGRNLRSFSEIYEIFLFYVLRWLLKPSSFMTWISQRRITEPVCQSAQMREIFAESVVPLCYSVVCRCNPVRISCSPDGTNTSGKSTGGSTDLWNRRHQSTARNDIGIPGSGSLPALHTYCRAVTPRCQTLTSVAQYSELLPKEWSLTWDNYLTRCR